jgi:hypothetical protein
MKKKQVSLEETTSKTGLMHDVDRGAAFNKNDEE